MNQNKQVSTIIRNHYDKIFLAERRVADFILASPEVAVNLNVAKLANKSGVSDATVVRFCKHIGFSGYYELRLSLSRDLGQKQATDIRDKRSAGSPDLFRSFADNLIKVGESLGTEILQEAAKQIHASKRAHIVAVGNTAPLSMYMGFLFGRMEIQATYNVVPEYFLNHINLADKHDTIIAISKSGESKRVLQALHLAKEKGLRSIVITAYGDSPCGKLADYLLLSSSGEEDFNLRKSYFHLNEMAVIDGLLHYVMYPLENIDLNRSEIMLSESKL